MMLKKIIIAICSAFVSIAWAQTYSIALDAGHGSSDKGTKIIHTQEANYTLEFCDYVELELSKFPNIQVLKTRKENEYSSMDSRIQNLNEMNPDLVVSFHLNASLDASENGFNFYYPENEYKAKSRSIGAMLIPSLQQFGIENRGLEPSTFPIIQNADCPAIWVDLGYITNSGDKEILMTDQEFMARAFAKYLILLSQQN